MKTRLCRALMLMVGAGLLGCSTLVNSPEPRTASDFGAMGLAKILCSAVFVSGRDLDEAMLNSAYFVSTTDRALLLKRES